MGPRTRTRHAVGACLILILAACGTADDDREVATDDSVPPAQERSTNLVIGAAAEPPNYDWIEGGAGLAVQVLLMHNVVEPLIEKTEDQSFEPLLAESFDVSADGREYVFAIREATFHDGSKLSADDVVYSLELHQRSSNPNVSGDLAAIETIDAVDDRTVKVTLSRPSQTFLDGLSRDSGLIIPKGSENLLERAPVGTGPFVFDEWRDGIDVSLTRFDNYWNEPPYFDDITWRFIPDGSALLDAVLAGDVDIVDQVQGDALERAAEIDATEGFRTVEQPGEQMALAWVNAEEEVFDDERVRQAIAYAIDRQTIIDGALAGVGQSSCVHANPPNVPWSSDYCPYPYDPDRSRALLAEAGAEDLTLEVTTPTVSHFPVATEILTSQFADVGITLTNNPVDLPTWLEKVPGGDYQFTHIAGSGQLDNWKCPGHYAKDCVPEFDELLEQADASTDRAEWAQLRRQAAEMHADRAYLIPLFNMPILSIVRDDLAGFKPYRSFVELDLRGLRWEE